MKLKRILAFVVAVVLCVGVLAGCSAPEIAYLDAVTEVGSWGNYVEEGTVSVSLAEEVSSYADVDIPVKDVTIDYKAQVDSDNSAILCDFNVKFDGDEYPIGVVSSGDTVGISKETIRSMKKLATKLTPESVVSGTPMFEFFEFFEDSLGEDEYVYIKFAEDSEIAEVLGASEIDLEKAKELVTSSVAAVKKTFSGYSTTLLSAEDDGTIVNKGDLNAVEGEVSNFLDYSAEHADELKSLISELLRVYVNLVYPVIPDSEKSYEDEQGNLIVKSEGVIVDELVEAFDISKDSLVTLKDDFAITLASDGYRAFKEEFKDSYFKSTFKLADDRSSLDKTFELNVVADGKSLVKVNAVSTTKKLEQGIQIDIKGIDYNNLSTAYDAYLNNKYPTTAAKIVWINTDYENARLKVERDCPDGDCYVARKTYIPLVMIDDRIYVPMRSIAESLGYEVIWDADAEKAFINKDGEFIDMTGIIVDDTTFIKVRDFEKVGLTVDYIEESTAQGIVKTATISK